ncbi:MAG: hypothetical protein K0R34_2160 [Herbinix sp.]|jgi:hypothetical protein|nr:hypothetical protein [Herbinix sp.]
MTLKQIRDWLKPQITDIATAYIGKTDPTQEKVICIYGRSSTGNKIAIGGLSNTSTATKGISILVQWSKNCDTTEQKAQSIYDIFNGTPAVISGKECFFNMRYDEPVPLGSNDNDIYEYVIDLTIIYKRG